MNQSQRISPVSLLTGRRQGKPRDGKARGTHRNMGAGAILLCYFCSMLLGLLLIGGAPLSSLLLVAHGGDELVGLAGSYSMVLLQQKEIQQKIEELAGEYQFDPALLRQEVDTAALAHFSRRR